MDGAAVGDLEEEIVGLDQFLLAPIVATAPDPLVASERRAISAYLVLVHGDIEEFVESSFYDYAAECLNVDDGGRVDPGLYQAVVSMASDLTGQFSGRAVMTPSELVQRVVPLLHRKYIQPNNGIRRENIKRMTVGVGLDWPQLETACADLIGALDTLGSRRGAIAHRGVAGVELQQYPEDVRKLVGEVVTRLPDLLGFLGERPRHQVGSGPLGGRLVGAGTTLRDIAAWWRNRPVVRRHPPR